MAYHYKFLAACLVLSVTTCLGQPIADTLTAQVTTALHGKTRDLSQLDVRVHSLKAGGSAVRSSDADQLIIVKDGDLEVGEASKTLGPGGVALLSANDKLTMHNPGITPATYYVFSFVTDSMAARSGPPLLLDWKEMPMKTTDKGESRQIFSQPTHHLSRIDMHATTLNEGQVSHSPHIHRNEEIILMRSGNARMYIGGKYYPAKAGDIIFLTSGTPHALENKTNGRCEYFALQWQR